MKRISQPKEVIMSRVKVTLLAAGTLLALAFTISCSAGDDNDYEMLNGVWDRGDIVVTFTDDKGVFTSIDSSSNWQKSLNDGVIKIGDRKFKDIKGSDLKWTGQQLCQLSVTDSRTDWHDCTITVSEDGQTLRTDSPDCTGSNGTGTGVSSYTRINE